LSISSDPSFSPITHAMSQPLPPWSAASPKSSSSPSIPLSLHSLARGIQSNRHPDGPVKLRDIIIPEMLPILLESVTGQALELERL
jgi:hypothetical protein